MPSWKWGPIPSPSFSVISFYQTNYFKNKSYSRLNIKPPSFATSPTAPTLGKMKIIFVNEIFMHNRSYLWTVFFILVLRFQIKYSFKICRIITDGSFPPPPLFVWSWIFSNDFILHGILLNTKFNMLLEFDSYIILVTVEEKYSSNW